MIIKEAFAVTKNNIILAQPLVVYLIVISLTSAGLSRVPAMPVYWVFFGANILLSTAFFAGWFYMFKKTVEHEKTEYKTQEEKSIASVKLIKHFFPGVGEYFLPVTAGILLYTVGFALVLYLGFEAGTYFLSNPHIDFAKIMAAQTPDQMQDYLMTLKPVQIKLLNLWFIYLGGISFVYTLLTMFWFPAMLFESKNPFLALWANFKFVFRNFFGSLGIVSYLFLMNFVVSGINALSGINIVLSIISLVITFYFMTYCLVLLFLYYGEKR